MSHLCSPIDTVVIGYVNRMDNWMRYQFQPRSIMSWIGPWCIHTWLSTEAERVGGVTSAAMNRLHA